MRKLSLILLVITSSLFLFNCQEDPLETDPVIEVSVDCTDGETTSEKPGEIESESGEDEDCKATDPTCVG